MWKRVVILAFVASALGNPVPENEGVAENLVSALQECLNGEVTLCLKEKAMRLSDQLVTAKQMEVVEGVSLVNTGSSRAARSYEPLSEEPKAREAQLEERISNNIGDFLDTHVLQLRLSSPKEAESRALDEEGRGKKKKKIKKLLPLLLLLKLKFAALIPVFLGIIAFVAIKAIFLGKIAFAVQAFGLIRKLLSKNDSSSGWSSGGGGYSYSPAPAHHDDHPGYNYEPASQGWSRSKTVDAQNLAYSGHVRK